MYLSLLSLIEYEYELTSLNSKSRLIYRVLKSQILEFHSLYCALILNYVCTRLKMIGVSQNISKLIHSIGVNNRIIRHGAADMFSRMNSTGQE